jgi:hypothetical protein
MLKKTIVYTDLNGDAQVEDWYFGLTKADLAEMEMTTEGGMATYLKRIQENQNGREIIDTFKMFIAMSVGQRSEDGRRFMRSPEISNDFMQSPAYEEFFMELVTDANFAAEFVNGLLPKDLARQIENVQLPEPKEYTHDELLNMDDAEFEAAVGNDPRKMSKDHLMVAFQRKNHKQAA